MNFVLHSAPRITEERKRLGLSQAAAATACGVSREMWGKYERAGAAIGSDVLALFALAGADVQYIVTGERRGQGLGESAVHQAVLDAVDLLSLSGKIDAQQLAKAVVKLCPRQGGSPMSQEQDSFNIGTNHGQVIKGGLVQNGPVNFGKITNKKS